MPPIVGQIRIIWAILTRTDNSSVMYPISTAYKSGGTRISMIILGFVQDTHFGTLRFMIPENIYSFVFGLQKQNACSLP